MSQIDSDFVTLQDNVGADGDGKTVKVDGSRGTFGVAQITAIGTATVNWEATVDGATWGTVRAEPLATGTLATTATATGLYRIDLRGIGGFRARISGHSGGNHTVLFRSQYS